MKMQSSPTEVKVKEEKFLDAFCCFCRDPTGNGSGDSRTIRDLPPAHYLFKIKSFSSLCVPDVKKYESDIFEAGGFKWKLSLYPNGHEERNGNGYVSLYLRIVQTESWACDWEVNANFKLFVFDQIRDKYLTIQDAEGIIRRFHEMKTEWGFTHLLSLNCFNDASNGYLVDDYCIFGAEVFVIKYYTGKQDYLPMVKELSTNSHTSKIENLSTLWNESHDSDASTMGGRNWKLVTYPKEDKSVKDKSLSLYVSLDDVESLRPNEEWHSYFELQIGDQVNGNHIGSAGIMRFLRDHPPSHYSVKVEPFSLLVKSQVEKYESGDFEVGGYKWKLILYPNGNKKADGADYISLYLVMEDVSSLPHRWEVNVDVKLFVFDQRRKKYLTIQDAIRPIKRFHEMETEFGFAKLLALETFNDANSGYLVDDCCIFGAEVFVIQPTRKSECLSITEDPHGGTFSCKLDNRKITIHPERYDEEKGVLRTIRDLGPAHFSFKIKSFSSVYKQETENYESDIFEAGGFKWRLSLYPNGCKERNGSGYASLYLRIVETGNMAPNWEVNVIFKLFVYDKLRDKYLAIQDADGIVRRFHDIKTEWGFSQLISLDDFKDASNGYIVDDCCSFGAEVFVIKHTGKQDRSSMVKEPGNNTFTWRIEKFSTLTEDSYSSDAFSMGQRKWKLQVYPKGESGVKDKSVSLFLNLDDGNALPRNQELHTKFKLKILDQVNDKHFERTCDCCFKYPNYGWGLSSFITLTNLHDASKGYVVSNAVIIEVIFTDLSMHHVFFRS